MIHLLICLGDVHHAFTLTDEEFAKERLTLLQFSSLVISNPKDLYLAGIVKKDRFGLFRTSELSTAKEVRAWIDKVFAGETNG